MAKATASPLARRHNGDRLRAKAKPRRHQTKEAPPPKHEPAWKHENKPGLHSPFSLTQIGTLSRRHLAQFVAAIDSCLSSSSGGDSDRALLTAFDPLGKVGSEFSMTGVGPHRACSDPSLCLQARVSNIDVKAAGKLP
jgi:hypothetical protein